MHNTPVLFIIFNRPDSTQKVFEAIRQAKPVKLYVAADGPRINVNGESKKCGESRAIINKIDWECDLKILFQERNLGCSLGPRTAFDWFFSHEKEGIILEDDCMPHPDFFTFATLMLIKYRNESKIISISGSNLGYELKNGESYTFSRFMNMWGWATWADRANAIDYSLNKWKELKNPLWYIFKKMRQNIFDFDINWYLYWKDKFDLTVKANSTVSWWDWQWIWHQISHEQLSIVPAVNLISNIGFNEEATHTTKIDNPASNLPVNPFSFPLSNPKKTRPDFIYEEKYVKWVWCYHKRVQLFYYIKKYLKKILFIYLFMILNNA